MLHVLWAGDILGAGRVAALKFRPLVFLHKIPMTQRVPFLQNRRLCGRPTYACFGVDRNEKNVYLGVNCRHDL